MNRAFDFSFDKDIEAAFRKLSERLVDESLFVERRLVGQKLSCTISAFH